MNTIELSDIDNVKEEILQLRELYKAVKIPHILTINAIRPCDMKGNTVNATTFSFSDKNVYNGYDDGLSDVIEDYCLKRIDELRKKYEI